MNIKKIEGLLRGMAGDLLMAAAGLVLMLNPAGAMAWLIQLLGWILVGFGAAKLLVPVLNHRPVSTGSWDRTHLIYLWTAPLEREQAGSVTASLPPVLRNC